MKSWLIKLLVVASLCASGCTYETRRKQVFADAIVVERDGCEYLIIYFDRSMAVTHKGDCKNPIHHK